MSDYFILTKQSNSDVSNDEKNQFMYVKEKVVNFGKNFQKIN